MWRSVICAMIMFDRSIAALCGDEDLARMIGVTVLEDLGDPVPLQPQGQMIPIILLPSLRRGGVRFALHRDVAAFAEDGAELHVDAIRHHRFEALGEVL